jgi:hypothetical protein
MLAAAADAAAAEVQHDQFLALYLGLTVVVVVVAEAARRL